MSDEHASLFDHLPTVIRMLSEWDRLFQVATKCVAKQLDQLARKGVELKEKKHLQPRTRSVLGDLIRESTSCRVAGYTVDDKERTLSLPNWKPSPGGLDIGIRRPGQEYPFCAAELKLDTHARRQRQPGGRTRNDIAWVLWDFIKMLDALYLPGVEHSYLMVGAPQELLTSDEPDLCLELFAEPGLAAASPNDLFDNNKDAWLELLGGCKNGLGGTGRPTSIPERVSTRVVANEGFGKSQKLLCIAIERSDADRICFPADWYCGDWPQTVKAPTAHLSWKRTHWQLAKKVADAGGSMSLDRVCKVARSLGITNYDKEYGLYYRGERMFRKPRVEDTVYLTDAGRAFLDEWDELGRSSDDDFCEDQTQCG